MFAVRMIATVLFQLLKLSNVFVTLGVTNIKRGARRTVDANDWCIIGVPNMYINEPHHGKINNLHRPINMLHQ